MTLSKLQNEQYIEIVKKFNGKNIITLEDSEYIRLREILEILEHYGCIKKIKIDNKNMYEMIGNFSDFDKWYKDKIREERKLTRREWIIAIVSAVIGALIGAIPSLIKIIKGC